MPTSASAGEPDLHIKPMPSSTQARLRTLAYNLWTNHEIHFPIPSSLRSLQINFPRDKVKCFLCPRKPYTARNFLPHLPDHKDCICRDSSWDKAELGISRHHWQVSYESIDNCLYDPHGKFGQLDCSIFASVQNITLALAKTDNETLLQVIWDLVITINCGNQIADHCDLCITCCLDPL